MSMNAHITITAPIHLAAGDDKSRYSLDSVSFETSPTAGKDKVLAVSTNGRMLAVLPCDCQGDTDGLPARYKGAFVRDAWTATPQRKGARSAGITLNGKASYIGNSGAVVSSDPVEGSFPPWKDVIPDISGGTVVTFNARLLADLAKSIGAENDVVTVVVPENRKKPMMVLPAGESGGFGVLMPCVSPEGDQLSKRTKLAEALRKEGSR